MANNLSKIVLVIEYEGINYGGFQYQINAPTVQNEIEKALLELTAEKIRVVAASRTDTGVHAKGQVVSFRTGSVLPPEIFVRALNHYLAQDIAVKAAYRVNEKFSVRADAISREYCYHILNSSIRSPLKRGHTYLVSGELNIEAMNEASRILVGEHDFASFVTDINNSVIKSTIRRVYKAQVTKRGELVTFDMVANAFLPHQIRNTVGTLIRVGLNKMSLEEFRTIMEAKKPGLAGPTVPAMGLCLVQVTYPRLLGDYNEDL